MPTAPQSADVTSLTVVGVRHHSPACARLVGRTIESLRPAHVLVEGPADMNDRIDELLLGHELPVAVFSSMRDDTGLQRSWSPLSAHSPEYVALVTARRVGARARFMDLPAWDPAFDRENRYSDSERHYAEVQQRLCTEFGVDNPDVLWDTLFELADAEELPERLAAYFELVRSESVQASDSDAAREAYMASWVRAAVADAAGRPVVAVCGGFHRPALLRLAHAGGSGWPEVPPLPEGAVGGSFVVPFSFKRMDAFDGYASGMPSPGYYQDLWDFGPAEAAERIVRRVATRLRQRKQLVSTADLVAARALTTGLTQVRGHSAPARTDVLDGLVSALVSDDLEVPLPWTGRGRLRAGTHPVVVEMVAALSGDAVGRLHPDTPAPPLVHDVAAELDRHRIPERGSLQLDLTSAADPPRSAVLHRLAVLALPGWSLLEVSRDGLTERWECTPDEHRHAALAEAGAYGRTLAEAAAARLSELADGAGGAPGMLAKVLESAVRCDLDTAVRLVVEALSSSVGDVRTLDGLGELLLTGTRVMRRSSAGAYVPPLLAAAATRTLWLLEGETGAEAPADAERELAVVGLREATRALGDSEAFSPAAVLDLAGRLAADRDRPPDLRGACVGLLWSLQAGTGGRDAAAAARASTTPAHLGDWLAGLFAVAREQVLADEEDDGVLSVVDTTLTGLTADDFLEALPALRQAFAWFPPREREQVASLVMQLHGVAGSAAALLRAPADPLLLARARALESRVSELLVREALLSSKGSVDE